MSDPIDRHLEHIPSFDASARQRLQDSIATHPKGALIVVDLGVVDVCDGSGDPGLEFQLLERIAALMLRVARVPVSQWRHGSTRLIVLLTAAPEPDLAAFKLARDLLLAISVAAADLGAASDDAAIGIAAFPRDGNDPGSLLRAAGRAAREAMRSDQTACVVYGRAIERRITLRRKLQSVLADDNASGELHLVYQPVVSLADGKVVGLEALARWTDPELGETAPHEFIAVAEQSDLIVKFGDWVLRQACRARADWQKLGMDLPPVSINISARQLMQSDFVDKVDDCFGEYRLELGDIEFEVTGTAPFELLEPIRENLIRLRNDGFRSALDSFGWGMSNLARARELPLNSLKIDRSFTVDCTRDARTLTIVKAVIEMARSIGVSVTAVGVEDYAVHGWMSHLGCDQAQGFLFSRPLAETELLSLFRSGRRASTGSGDQQGSA
jgi:EAL domain-containing protein (putative c-di-GMP-specific phosphodiesterase class I)